MAFDDTDRKWYFDELNNMGYDTGSYDDFKTSMNNKEDREWYYNELQKQGYDTGSIEDFQNSVQTHRMNIGGQEVWVGHKEYTDFMKRHPSGNTKGKPLDTTTDNKPSSNTFENEQMGIDAAPQVQTPYFKTQQERDREQFMPFAKYADEQEQQRMEQQRKKEIRDIVGEQENPNRTWEQSWEQRGKLRKLEQAEGYQRGQDVAPFFDKYVKPELDDKERKAFAKIDDEYKKAHPYDDAELGGNPLAKMVAKNSERTFLEEKYADPKKLIDKVMKNISPDITTEKGQAFNDLILKRMGMSSTENSNEGNEKPMSDDELEAFNRYYSYEYGKIAEEIQNQLYDKYKKAGVPNSTLEYIASAVIKDNIANSIAHSMAEKAAHSSGMRRQMRDMAIESYGKDAGILANAARGAAGIATDPLMYAVPGIGSAVAKGITKTYANALAKSMILAADKRISKEAVGAATRYLLANNQALNVAQRAIASGVTLGGISMAHTGSEQFRRGEFNGMELLESFGENALVGAATGGIAGKIESMARLGGRAARVGAAMGGYATNVAGFSAYQMWEKARAQGKDVSDMSIGEWAETVGENAVMFGIMDLPKMAKTMRERGSEARKMGMELTPDMVRELDRADYSSLFETLLRMADYTPERDAAGEKGAVTLRTGMEENGPLTEGKAEQVLDELNKLVTDNKISSETRRRVYWYATGKMLVPDAVYATEIKRNGEKYDVVTYNRDGQMVESRTFDNLADAQSHNEQFDIERQANTTRLLETVAQMPATHFKSAIAEVAKVEGLTVEQTTNLFKIYDAYNGKEAEYADDKLMQRAKDIRKKVEDAMFAGVKVEGEDMINSAIRETKAQTGVDISALDRSQKKGLFGKGMTQKDIHAVDVYIDKLQHKIEERSEARDFEAEAKQRYLESFNTDDPSMVKRMYDDVSKAEDNLSSVKGASEIAETVTSMMNDGKTEGEVDAEIVRQADGDKALVEAVRQYYVALEGLKGLDDRINAMVEARMEEEKKNTSRFVVQPADNINSHSPQHAGITTFMGRTVYLAGLDNIHNPTKAYIIDPGSRQQIEVSASRIGRIYEVPRHIGKAVMDGREVYITGITNDGKMTVIGDITKEISNNGIGEAVDREKISNVMLNPGMVVGGTYNNQRVYVTSLTDDSAVIVAADGQKYVVGSGDVSDIDAVSMDELLQLKGVEARSELESEVEFYAKHNEKTERDLAPTAVTFNEDGSNSVDPRNMGTVFFGEGDKAYIITQAENNPAGRQMMVMELVGDAGGYHVKEGSARVLTDEQIYNEQDEYYQRQDEKRGKAEAENAETKPTVETKVEAGEETIKNSGDGEAENGMTEGKSSGTDVNGEERGGEASVIDDQYGYSLKDYEDERLLNEQYSKELSDISSIEDDEKFEEAANALERKLPSGFNVFWNSENGAFIALGEPSVYSDINGTRRKFNIGDVIQLSIDGRNPHIIITNIDESGKVVDAIDMQDGRYVVKNGNKLSTNEIINQKKRIADQRDQNGSPYMLNNNGSIDFGMITADKNITEAPVRISLGDAENGYVHIEKRHGKQIRNEGYNGVLEFIQHVLDNFNVIKKGDFYPNSEGGVNQTYYVTLSDEHNNVLFVQLARDESYWNINSAGIFRRGYGKNKETIWSASEVQNSSSATTDNALQSKPNADEGSTSNGTASSVSSDGKNTPSSSNEQEKAETINLNGEEHAVSDIESAVLSHVNSIIGDAEFDAEIVGVKLIGSRMNGTAREDSDLDVLVEYNGKAKEDTLFNALNDEPLVINGVTVDINPITKSKSGTIEQFLKRNAGYVKERTESEGEPSGTVADGKPAGTVTQKIQPTEQPPSSSPIADALGMSGKKKENKNSLASRVARLQPDEVGRWEDYVLITIGGGVKFKSKDDTGSKGIVSHTTGNVKDIPLVMLDNVNGASPEKVAEQIYADMPERFKEQCTDQDVFNEIIDIIMSYPSYNAMLDAAEERLKSDAEAEEAAIIEDAKDRDAQSKGFRDYADLQSHEASLRIAREQMDKAVAKMDVEQLTQQLADWVLRVNRAQQKYERSKTLSNYKVWTLEYERYKAVKTAYEKIGTYDNDTEGFFDKPDGANAQDKGQKAVYVRYDAKIGPDGKEIYTKTDTDGKTVPATRVEYLKARKANPDIATSKEELKQMKDEYAISSLKKKYPSITDAEGASDAIEAIEQQMAEADLDEQHIKQLKDQIADLKKMKRILGAETSADYLIEDPDMQLSDFSEKDQTRIREAAKWITKKDARRMLEMAYNIQKPYLDENISFDNWVKQTPTSEITMIVDDEYAIQETFLNPIYEKNDRFGNDFWSEHLVDAYKLNLLDDSNAKAKQAQRVDLGKAVRVADSRFYAPKQIELAEETLGIARQRVTKSNKAEVLEARQKIILFAHNEGAAEAIGMSKAEFNKLLRSWTRESPGVREISQKMNKDVEESNRWCGIENMAATNAYTISDEEIERMTGGVEGDSNGVMRKDIARTMLAIDTHTDWSGIKIKFAGTKEFEEDFGTLKDPKKVAGFYVKSDRLVEVRQGRTGHTTPHEMGHALDHTWGLEFGFNNYLTHSKGNKLTGDAKLFVDHVNEFITDLIKVNADIRNDYTTDRTEVFARFVDYFVNYTESIANNTPMRRNQYFEDKFTAANVLEFVKILQEKSVLDSQKSESLSVEAINNRFNEELVMQKNNELPSGHIYKLGMPSRILLSTGIPSLPIQMNPKRLLDKATKFGHDFDIEDVKDLVNSLQVPLAVFAYGDADKAQNIVVEIQKDDKNFIVGLSLNPIVGGKHLEINSIRNVFPKDNAEWLNWISQGKLLYCDKQKIKTLIDKQQTNLADVEYLDLNSIANIIDSFENPVKPEEENTVSPVLIGQNSNNTPDLQSEDDTNFMIELTDAGNHEVWEHGKINIPDKVILVKNGSGAVVYGADARKVAKELGTEMEGDRITLNGGDVAMLEKTMGDGMRLISYEDAEGRDYIDADVKAGIIDEDYTARNAAEVITNHPEYKRLRTEIEKAHRLFVASLDDADKTELVNLIEDYAGALQAVVDGDVERRVSSGAAKIFAKEVAAAEAYIDEVLDGSMKAPKLGLVKMTKGKTSHTAGIEKPSGTADVGNSSDEMLPEEEFSGETLQIGTKDIPLRISEVSVIGNQRENMPTSETARGWNGVDDKVVLMTSNLRARYPELHAAAKHGDVLAARDLVAGIYGLGADGVPHVYAKGSQGNAKGNVNILKVAQMYRNHPDAIVTYPHRQFDGASNVLGQAYAQFLEDFGFEMSDAIEMINRPRHTDADKEGRFMRRSRFAGDVEAGREYIIVDDHVTMGSTVRDMKDYIESKGGKVVAISAMTSSRGDTGVLIPSTEQIDKIKELGVTDEQLKQFGITDHIENLTRGEAEQVIRMAERGRARTSKKRKGGAQGSVEGHVPSSRKVSAPKRAAKRGNAERSREASQETIAPPEDIVFESSAISPKADAAKTVTASESKQEDGTDLITFAKTASQERAKQPKRRVYKSKGEVIRYKQLTFFDDAPEGEKKGSTPLDFRLKTLKSGDTCLVERRYTEDGAFVFSGKNKIESPEDVAYLFRRLEDKAVENTFFAIIDKNGIPTIIHCGMGTPVQSPFDAESISLAVQNIDVDKIFMVHNHPSGNLRPSAADRQIFRALKLRHGNLLQPGIIIDTLSGKYSEFVESGNYIEDNRPQNVEGEEVNYKVYAFDKQVFSRDFNPGKMRISNATDVSAFLSSHRLGDHAKTGVLIINNNSDLMADIALPFNLNEENITEQAKYIADTVTAVAGRCALIYGSGINWDAANKINAQLKKMSPVVMFDTLEVEGRVDGTLKVVSGRDSGQFVAEDDAFDISRIDNREPKQIYSAEHIDNEEKAMSFMLGEPDDSDDPHPEFPALDDGELLTDDSYVAKMDRYHEEVRAWKQRQREREEKTVDEALFSGDATGAPTTGVEALDTPENREKEQFDDMMNGLKIDVTERAMRKMIKGQIRERRRLIETANFEDAILVHDIKKVTTAEERKRIPFILEGSDTESVSDELKKTVDKIRNWYDEMHQFMSEEGLFKVNERQQYVTNYVTHIWDFENVDPKKYEHLENWISQNSPYTKDRIIPTLQAGLDMGLKLKYEDITDVLMDYGHRATEAVANRRLVNFLKGFRMDGHRVLLPAETYDLDYDIIKNNALRGFRVYKPLIPLLNVIFGELHWSRDPGLQKLGHVYDIAAGTMKKINLSMSFFHHGALTETAVAMMGPQEFMRVLVKKMMHDIAVNKELPAFNDPEAARDAIGHFVVLGATQDYATKEVLLITERIKKMVEGLRGLEEAAAIADFINKGMDTVLWDWLHDGYKIYAFKKIADEIRSKAIKGKDGNGWTVYNEGWDLEKLNIQLDEAGQLVNDTFGGQHWDLLSVTPGQVKFLRRILMSGDWTFSTMRQAAAPFGIGALYDDRTLWEQLINKKEFLNDKEQSGVDTRKKYSRAFWLMGLCVLVPLWNMMNMAFRIKDEYDEREKAIEIRKSDPSYKSPYEIAYPDGMKWWDYTMLGNTYGHRTNIFIGRDSQDIEIFSREGKQFREAIELIYGRDGFDFPQPLVEKMVGKLNPGINAMKTILTGESILGWESPYMKNKTGWARKLGMLQVLVTSYLPYSIPTDDEKEFMLMDLIMPSTKGFSPYKARKYFEVAILSGDMDLMGEVYKACVMNGLNADELFDATCTMVEATARKNMIDGIENVGDAMAMYDKEESPKKRSQLDSYIRKMMSAQDWKQIEKGEFEQKANDYIDGVGVDSHAFKVYDRLKNSNDIVEDWRLSKACTGLKPYADAYKDLLEEDRLKAMNYYNANKERIDKYYELNKYRTTISSIKRNMGKKPFLNSKNVTVDDNYLMKEIRRTRKEILEKQ